MAQALAPLQSRSASSTMTSGHRVRASSSALSISVELATTCIAGWAPASSCSRPHSQVLWSDTSMTRMTFFVDMLYLFT